MRSLSRARQDVPVLGGEDLVVFRMALQKLNDEWTLWNDSESALLREFKSALDQFGTDSRTAELGWNFGVKEPEGAWRFVVEKESKLAILIELKSMLLGAI